MMPNYSTNLTDSEWKLLESIQQDKRKRKHELRVVWNAIFYLVRTGCQWRMLPTEFPKWQLVYYYYRQWRDTGVFAEVLSVIHARTRLAAGREASPSAAAIDSQSVKCARGEHRGIDGNKRVNGRKRHIAVDTTGLLMAVVVTAANVADVVAARRVIERLRHRFPRLRRIFADSGYQGEFIAWVAALTHWVVEITHRAAGVVGFQVLPKRWVVERSFAWLNGSRRLSKDYELLTDSSQAMIQLSAIRLMLKRLRHCNS